MSPAASSLQIWTVYVVLIGAALLLIPNTLLALASVHADQIDKRRAQ